MTELAHFLQTMTAGIGLVFVAAVVILGYCLWQQAR